MNGFVMASGQRKLLLYMPAPGALVNVMPFFSLQPSALCLTLPCRTLVVAGGVIVFSTCFSSLANAEPHKYQFEVGPTLSFFVPTTADNSSNISYGSAISPGVFVRGTLLKPLLVSARYSMGSHAVSTPKPPEGVAGSSAEVDDARLTTLSLLIHPTYSPLPWLHTMATLGISWTKLALPTMTIDPPLGPKIHSRGGIFLSAPLGLGITADWLRNWLTTSLDFAYSPAFSHSGDVFGSQRFVDSSGQNANAGPMPKITALTTVTFSAAVAFLCQVFVQHNSATYLASHTSRPICSK